MGSLSATKDGSRLAQSLGLQPTEKIGFSNVFSSPQQGDSAPCKKGDSNPPNAALFSIQPPQTRWEICPDSTSNISPDGPISAKVAGSAPVIQTCAPSWASSPNRATRRAG